MDVIRKPLTFSSTTMGSAGDFQCAGANGVHCMLWSLPEGYGLRMFTPIHLSANLNDVRGAGSPPLQWSLLSSVRVTREAQKSVVSQLSFNPVDLRHGDFGLYYFVTAGNASAFW